MALTDPVKLRGILSFDPFFRPPLGWFAFVQAVDRLPPDGISILGCLWIVGRHIAALPPLFHRESLLCACPPAVDRRDEPSVLDKRRLKEASFMLTDELLAAWCGEQSDLGVLRTPGVRTSEHHQQPLPRGQVDRLLEDHPLLIGPDFPLTGDVLRDD